MLLEFDKRRKVLVNGLNSIEGIKCLMPKGAFYAFPSIKGTGMMSGEFSEFMITKAKVVMVPGNVFGEKGEGYIRASFVASLDQIKEALVRIEEALAKN